MTMKHERGDEPDQQDIDEPGVPDEELDPITEGWTTALGLGKAGTDNENATAEEVAQNEDLGTDRPD